MPALNARPAEQLDEWLAEITEALAAHDRAHPERPAAPYAINQIVHKSNDRLDHDMQVCEKYKVPVVITSLGARTDVNDAVHRWGGVVLHDIISNTFAHKAVDKGADGLIAVAAGAGGHAGVKSPFALMHEIRGWFDGPVALSGAIATGDAVLAARALGADFAYIGSAFIATDEARASDDYKRGIVEGTSRRHRLQQPLHRRARQLPEGVDPRLRARPGQPAGERSEQDELRRRRLEEGLEGHLGQRPGHRRDEGGGARGRAGRAAAQRVRGGARAAAARLKGRRRGPPRGARPGPMRDLPGATVAAVITWAFPCLRRADGSAATSRSANRCSRVAEGFIEPANSAGHRRAR